MLREREADLVFRKSTSSYVDEYLKKKLLA